MSSNARHLFAMGTVSVWQMSRGVYPEHSRRARHDGCHLLKKKRNALHFVFFSYLCTPKANGEMAELVEGARLESV